MEELSLNEFPLSLWVFLPSPRVTVLGSLLLNKKEVANIMQAVPSSSFTVKKKDHSKRKTNILSFSVVKVQLQCSLRKKRERTKRNFFWFYSPKWCIPLYLPRYLLNALNIAGRNCKWNDIWTLLHLDKDINSHL